MKNNENNKVLVKLLLISKIRSQKHIIPTHKILRESRTTHKTFA